MDHSSRDGQSSKETADFKINPTPLENKEFALPLLDLIKIFFISIVLEVPKLLISLIQNLMKKPKSLKDKICLVSYSVFLSLTLFLLAIVPISDFDFSPEFLVDEPKIIIIIHTNIL